MMRSPALSISCGRALPFAAALAVAAWLTPAAAQGTAEQREACAPDAINLCQDTIPDVEKTKACMKAHLDQLSPKCRAEFSAATGTPNASPPASARGAPDDDDDTDETAAIPPPDAAPDVDSAGGDSLKSYRATILGYCRQGLIDRFTCRSTLRALDAAR